MSANGSHIVCCVGMSKLHWVQSHDEPLLSESESDAFHNAPNTAFAMLYKFYRML